MLIAVGVNPQSLAFSDSPVADATDAVSCEKKAEKISGFPGFEPALCDPSVGGPRVGQ